MIAEGDGLLQVFLADTAEYDVVVALALYLLAEGTVLLGEEHSDGLVGLALLEHADGGEGFCLAKVLVCQYALNGGLGCHHC